MKRSLKAFQSARVIMVDAMRECARSNSAAQKTSHKCCVAALCTNRSDNRKDLFFHDFPKDSQRMIKWALKMK